MSVPEIVIPESSREMFSGVFNTPFESESVGLLAQSIPLLEYQASLIGRIQVKNPELGTLATANETNHELTLWTKTLLNSLAEFGAAEEMHFAFRDPLFLAAIPTADLLVKRANSNDVARETIVFNAQQHLEQYYQHLKQLLLAAAERLEELELKQNLLIQKRQELRDNAEKFNAYSDPNTTKSLEKINAEIKRLGKEIRLTRNNMRFLSASKKEISPLRRVINSNTGIPAIHRTISLDKAIA